ncbi:uncharacterized protein LOC105770539 isoform X2 [Gossypium raimondii]|uniref:uncharacterized protein LOC105770539 isoform X2 n=1 Tax=Gossypium raimondii TaxID=29730 RepID=UPI00227CA2AD|nr:uncharacterized protein LOC105770539 isoform X2 [Gossypium raimondii]
MGIPQEIDDYMKRTIDDSLGLPISTESLQLKLRSSEETQRRLREQYLLLLSKLKEKDQIIERSKIDSSSEGAIEEDNLLEPILAALICKIEVTSGRAFLEANTSLESCLRLLKMWNRLRPSTQKILTLAAEVKTLKKDKEHLRINLSKAEEEVKILFEENNILDEANKRLVRQSREEKNLHDSGRKHTGSASAKTNKRKSSPKVCSPIEKKINFTETDSTRKPLSPFRYNSPI